MSAGGPRFAIRTATPVDARGIAEVHVAAWRETYGGILPADCIDGHSVEERQAMWRDVLERESRPGAGLFVAKDPAGRIVGFGAGGRQRERAAPWDGEVYALYVLAAHQGAGLGRRLLSSIAAAWLQAGWRSANALVLRGNAGAARFYQRMGAVRDETSTFEMNGHTIAETSFVWRDLATAFAPDAGKGDKE